MWVHKVMFPSSTLLFLRSANYGSPNHRKRVYIIGVREDVAESVDLNGMFKYIESCSECHARSSLFDCALVEQEVRAADLQAAMPMNSLKLAWSWFQQVSSVSTLV